MRVDWWSLSDAELERQCDRDHYRASGPGGQHRNKTDSAVRLRHRPTGLIVTATERRSQAENRVRAVKRLRDALAFEFRQPVTDDAVAHFVSSHCATGRLSIPAKNPHFLPVIALVLDLLELHEGQLSVVANRLSVSTASISKLLACNSNAWQAAQRIRQAFRLSPLR